jgi:hypothetical protein
LKSRKELEGNNAIKCSAESVKQPSCVMVDLLERLQDVEICFNEIALNLQSMKITA